MKLPHPFIQLPLAFDATLLAEEVAALGEEVWRPHPQNFPGNSMLPLLASGGDPSNESFAGPMRPTPHLERCPYLWRVMAALGATLGRSRLMRLDGNAEVTPHADQGYYWINRVRVHVPIATRPTVRFICGDVEVNMAAGECWIFDTWRIHRVINDNDLRRIHLVVDTVGGEQFWTHVANGREQPAQSVTAGWTTRLVTGDTGALPRLDLETVNLPDVMTPWEIETHLRFLLDEAGADPHVPELQRHANAFVRDWRGLWARFGAAAEGRALYRRRLETFMTTMRTPAARVTLKNEINLFGAIVAMIGKIAVTADNPQPAAAMFDRA